MKHSVSTQYGSRCATALALVWTMFVPAHTGSFGGVQVLSNDEITAATGRTVTEWEMRGGNGRSSIRRPLVTPAASSVDLVTSPGRRQPIWHIHSAPLERAGKK